MVIDESDPCAAAALLRAAYASIVSGTTEQEISFRAGPNGVERKVVYGKADPARLLALLRDYEKRCSLTSGARPRRFGLRAGGGY